MAIFEKCQRSPDADCNLLHRPPRLSLCPPTQTQTHSQRSSDGSPPDKHALVDLVVLPGCSRKLTTCTPPPFPPSPLSQGTSEEVRKELGGFQGNGVGGGGLGEAVRGSVHSWTRCSQMLCLQMCCLSTGDIATLDRAWRRPGAQGDMACMCTRSAHSTGNAQRRRPHKDYATSLDVCIRSYLLLISLDCKTADFLPALI